MPTYTVRYRGQIRQITNDHPPTLSDMERNVDTPTLPANVPVQSTNPSFHGQTLDAAGRVEQKIQQRPSAIQFLGKVVRNPSLIKTHPFLSGLNVISAPLEAGESFFANAGLQAQRGQIPPVSPLTIAMGLAQNPSGTKRAAEELLAGVLGKRPAKLSDIAEASGLPILSNPAVASGVGFAASLGSGLFTKVGQKAAARASEEIAGHTTGALSLSTVGSRAKLAQQISEIPEVARERLSQRFGPAIDAAAEKQVADPSLLFDLQEVGQKLQTVQSHLRQGVRHAGNDIALTLAEEPSIGTNIGIMESRQIKAAIQRSPEINRPTEAGRILRQSRDLIRAQEVEKLGLGKTFQEFKTGMDAYRQVSPRLERLGVSSPVTSGLKGVMEAERTRRSLEHLATVGGNRQGFIEALGAARTAGTQRFLGTAARRAVFPLAAGVGLYAAGRKLFHRVSPPQ